MVEKVGIVILLCLGSASSELRAADQDSQSGTLDFGFVPSGVYETHAYYEPGPIGILFHMAHAFLYVVQPNPFPRGKLCCSCCSQNSLTGADWDVWLL